MKYIKKKKKKKKKVYTRKNGSILFWMQFKNDVMILYDDVIMLGDDMMT